MHDINGAITALITPFDNNNKVDIESLSDLVSWQINEGIHGLLPCGTTGEISTLSQEEYKLIVKTCTTVANKRVPVIVGAGSNDTYKVINMTNESSKLGADAVLVVTPFYNKPTQDCIYEHFKIIHDNTSLPIIVYDIPSRTSVAIENHTLIRISALKKIIGIKDATALITRPLDLKNKIKNDFTWLSGNDDSSLALNLYGGKGCISVLSNIFPKLCAKMQELSLKGKHIEAVTIYKKLHHFNDVLFKETNPIPIKWALHKLRNYKPLLRRPLKEASPELQNAINIALEDYLYTD